MDNDPQTHPQTNEGRMEEFIGRIKEAAGVLFGNRDMKREGQADRWTGQAKSTASEAIDEVRDTVESLADSLSEDEDAGTSSSSASAERSSKHRH
jgi:uncharacterized protein YjbJ (UPF0337 family)